MASIVVPAPAARPPRVMRFWMALVAVWTMAAVVAVWALVDAPLSQPRNARAHPAAQPGQVLPPTVIPPVEPIAYADIPVDEARVINAGVPFSTAPNPAARPFLLKEPPIDRARAVDCLAAAMLYEAGSGDPEGQRAVAQVIINRMRHPAFPKTICGVVFQGQERRTGCQFTFTCDGALARIPSPAAWTDAQRRAAVMLDGDVFAQVGHSTHYHTDWVVPYWSASLDKVTAVRTHLFFRWTGWWGTPPAFRGGHGGPEPAIRKLSYLSAVHRAGSADSVDGVDPLDLAAFSVQPVLQDGAGTFVLLFDKSFSSNDFPALAASVCGDRPFCKVLAWSDKTRLPRALPVPTEATGTMGFSYLRDRARGFDKALWNCAEHPRPEPVQCMKQRIVLPVQQAPLAGVRFKGDPSAAPKAVRPAPPPAATSAPITPPTTRPTLPAGSDR